MGYLFDEPVNRYGTDCVKYDFSKEYGKPEDVLPLWVADMDFMSPPGVKERLETIVNHNLYGYTDVKDDYFDAIQKWYGERFNWKIKKEWLVKTPGVVCAIATAIRSLTEAGDSVLIQPPVYHPFSEVVKRNHRRLVTNPLDLSDGKYQINFEDFERKIREEHVKLFILCSPHNPVGRVWSEKELRNMGEICKKNHVIVVSDEIHNDFVYPGSKHTVFSGIDPSFAEFTITCTAPSKTFNLAGLHTSNIFIPNEDIRNNFQEEIEAGRYGELNTMGLAACKAAYEKGEQWLEQLLVYLKGNQEFVEKWLKEKLPCVHMTHPEGTYLAWLDFRELGMSDLELDKFLSERAHVWLSPGLDFGEGGECHMRMNLACQRSTLEEALRRITEAIENR